MFRVSSGFQSSSGAWCAVPACRALLTGQRSPSRQTVLGVVGSSTPELYDPTRQGKRGTTRPRDPSLAELPLRSLLRCCVSHPKDERGSVREIGLCVWVDPTPHFLELMRVVFGLLISCVKWSFSGPSQVPERERKWVPKWTRKGSAHGS